MIQGRWVKGVVFTVMASGLVGCQSQMDGKSAAGVAAMASNGSNPADATTFAATVDTSVKKTAAGFVVNSLDAPSNQTYYFTFDGANMQQTDYAALNRQARYLASHPNAKVRLEGNADNRGSREYNIGLGWRRDQAVARMLEQQGVRPSQIAMVSYGKERPVMLGDSDHAFSLNRRVNLIYEAS